MGRYALEICAKRQGDMSEIKALSSTGPVDIITLDITRKKDILVDVKTQPPAKTTGIYRIPNKTKIQQNLDVQFLFYDKNTDTFTWEKDIVNE